MKLRLDIIFATFILLFLFAAQGFAQTTALPGRVLDSTGAAIVNAAITATRSDAGAEPVTTRSNDRGDFSIALTPGSYSIAVTALGFADMKAAVIVPAAAPEPHKFVLHVAGFSDSVSVSASRGLDATVSSATKTPTPLRDVPQSITVVTQELMRDQLMTSVADVVRYVPGIATQQGENNRDQIIVRGQNTSADFFVNGVRDDVQYFRDLYNLDRIEALKGPNALIFGRGGGGGLVNRITKEALPKPVREVSAVGGTFGHKRVTADLGGTMTGKVAIRLNGMYEETDSFRDAVGLERYGITPTITIAPRSTTKIKASYQYLHDARVADRGISSFGGKPASVDIGTYYGNPADSHVGADVGLAAVDIEQQFGTLIVTNHSLYGDYERRYQNYVPGAATADQQQVALSAYNNATYRRNFFNQTDVVLKRVTGSLRHTLLGGAEFGRQLTDNFRNTGYFNSVTTSILVPFSRPTITTPVAYRQSATDADNHVRTQVAAAYAQDQVEISRFLQLIGGVRFDRFDLTYHNNRNGETLRRVDDLVSPRGGFVIKPRTALSLYGSYSTSFLPSSGDQFSSLTNVTQQLKPERFTNYEGGVKWDVFEDLSLTSAVYRLNRTNTRATDPNDATRIVQTGSSRTNGVELGLTGRVNPRWRISGGYAYQDAYVSSATANAAAGARIAQVPRHSFSIWNNYQVRSKVGVGVGVMNRTDTFAAIDNTVTLPGYVRADAAAYYTFSKQARLQVNVENVFDTTYYVNADNNTNISPGSPRAIRVGVSTAF